MLDSNSENAIVGGVVPREYIPAVEAGLKDAMENGVLARLPNSRLKLSFTMDHTTMSIHLKLAFKVAASMALKQLLRKLNLSSWNL